MPPGAEGDSLAASAPGPEPGPQAPEAGGAGAGSPRLVVVRHGETEWSRDGRHTGRTDLALTAHGREQAAELGRRLRGHQFSRVLTSPLQRAAQTCAIAGFGDGAEVCEDLHEWDYGTYEGRTTDDIRAQRPDWSLWSDGAPDGERAEDVAGRVDRVIASVRTSTGDVLAFAHSHVLRVLGARWVGLPGAAGAIVVLDPATVSVLGWERENAVVVRWNDAAGDALR